MYYTLTQLRIDEFSVRIILRSGKQKIFIYLFSLFSSNWDNLSLSRLVKLPS